MRELSLKFIYQGQISFIEFFCDIVKDIDSQSRVAEWKGWIKIESEKIYISEKKYFITICTRIRDILEDKKNIPIEIYLVSNEI